MCIRDRQIGPQLAGAQQQDAHTAFQWAVHPGPFAVDVYKRQDYNDILSQRIQSSQRALGLEVNLAEETPVDVTSSCLLYTSHRSSLRIVGKNRHSGV